MTGGQKLREWIKANGLKQKFVMEQIGGHPSMMGNWISGRHKPMMVARKAIEAFTKGAVTVADWDAE